MKKYFILIGILIAGYLGYSYWPRKVTPPKPATAITAELNAKVAQDIQIDKQQLDEDTDFGSVYQPKNLVIKDERGYDVWNQNEFERFLQGDTVAPASVNPLLWTAMKSWHHYGLFRATEHVYQVRGYDLSNMTVVETPNGFVVIDPLIGQENARAAMNVVYQKIGKYPIKAVIYTHSHIDHFGGALGIITRKQVFNGEVMVVAPEDFMSNAISENVYVGNVMARRAAYMFGSLLPAGPKSTVGPPVTSGMPSLITPNVTISKTGQMLVIDGIQFQFQVTMDTEAPSEMNVYMPQFKALNMADNTIGTMHNLLTPRGTQVRDAKKWAEELQVSLNQFAPRSVALVQGHGVPIRGTEQIKEYLQNTHDMYKYIHDQALRLANEGYTKDEIAEQMQLPPKLNKLWYNRQFYGNLVHNSKAVYQRYLGWFDGNPATLNELPPRLQSKKIVQYMGGEAAVIKQAKQDFKDGNYRWVAQVMNHVVFANPSSKRARDLEADALEQLGYQAESGPMRNFYLTGAMELRDGVMPRPSTVKRSRDIISEMPSSDFFEVFAIRLNGPKAEGKEYKFNFVFPDTKEKFAVLVKNGVLNYWQGKALKDVDALIMVNRSLLNQIATGQKSFIWAVLTGSFHIDGSRWKTLRFFSLLDDFPTNFPIVTPVGS